MSEIINLRQFKKQKARDAKQKQADQNRIDFGRTKAEKDAANKAAQKSSGFLDQNRLERDADKGDAS
ncbi:DUF4169 family protein [Brucellaceae bacterium D45D]